MGSYASGSGNATIMAGKVEELKKVLKTKYGELGRNCKLDYDLDYDDLRIDFWDSQKYYEEDTMDFLNTIAPFINEGCMDYSGEDSVWRFKFDPDQKDWHEEDATIDYNFESYSDDELMTELKKRGYSVTKTAAADEAENTDKSENNTVKQVVDALYKIDTDTSSEVMAQMLMDPDLSTYKMYEDLAGIYVDNSCNSSFRAGMDRALGILLGHNLSEVTKQILDASKAKDE